MRTPRSIIAESWAITKKGGPIRRWGFASTLLETLLNAKLFGYQSWFAYSYFVQGNPVGFFAIESVLFENLPFWAFITIIIAFCILVLIEFFFPHMATGAIIGLAAKMHRQEEPRGGLVLALYNFFPIFVVRELFFLASIPTVTTLASLILRYGALKGFTVTILLILFFFCIILRFFSSFAEEAIVITKVGPFTAIGRSFKLIISYLGHVMFLILLMIVITLRIFINAAMFFLAPAIAIGIGLILALFLPHVLSYTIATFVGLIILGILSYFLAYLHIFKQTVWTLTFLELNRRKDLDIIEEPPPPPLPSRNNRMKP